jgi:hypothetical protein
LYYDLEFSTETNPDVNGARAVDSIVRLTLERLASEHAIGQKVVSTDIEGAITESIAPFDPKDVVVELKSAGSEEAKKKFSRHLVFRLPGIAFASAAHCGAFVRKLHADIATRRVSDPACDCVFVRKENASLDSPRDVSFVDRGVYTRNRAFRLYLSSKHGKKHRLLPTRRFFNSENASCLESRSDANPSLRIPATLPCFATFEACLVSAPGFVETSSAFASAARRLVRDDEVGTDGAPTAFRGSSVLTGYGDPQLGTRPPPFANARHRGTACPLPQTSAFVCFDFDSWSPLGCAGAAVSSWSACPDAGKATLRVRGNRFCENVERAHKNNNVTFTVDFREGAYYQKCLDPECRGFQGRYRPLPDSLITEALAFGALARSPSGERDAADRRRGDADAKVDAKAKAKAKAAWSPPRIGSDDDDDALYVAADARATGSSGARSFENTLH